MKKERLLELIEEVEGTALDAVKHVGAANYAEREAEAKGWVRGAVDKLRIYVADREESTGASSSAWCVVYKCRRCGEPDKTSHIGAATTVLQSVIYAAIGMEMQLPIGTQPQMLSTHSCADGGIGISDLVGGEREDDAHD